MIGTGVFTFSRLSTCSHRLTLRPFWCPGHWWARGLCGALSYAELGTAPAPIAGEYISRRNLYPAGWLSPGWISAKPSIYASSAGAIAFLNITAAFFSVRPLPMGQTILALDAVCRIWPGLTRRSGGLSGGVTNVLTA